MKAIVVANPGGPDALALTDLPEPTSVPGSVVVRVRAAGVNPVDTGNRVDPGWAGIRAPYVVGYEFSGTVVGAGEGFADGELVWGALPVRGTRWGAYAQFVRVPAQLVARLPDALDLLSGGCLPLAGLTAWQVLERLALPPRSWLMVYGAAGGVGHLLVQLARSRGINVAASSRSEQRGLLQELGVTIWADRTASDVAAALRTQLGGPFDATVDLVGGHTMAALAHVRDGGQAASIVDLTGDFEAAVDHNITLHGVLLRPDADDLTTLGVELGNDIRPRIREVFPLERAADAHRRLEAGSVDGKLVLDIDAGDG